VEGVGQSAVANALSSTSGFGDAELRQGCVRKPCRADRVNLVATPCVTKAAWWMEDLLDLVAGTVAVFVVVLACPLGRGAPPHGHDLRRQIAALKRLFGEGIFKRAFAVVTGCEDTNYQQLAECLQGEAPHFEQYRKLFALVEGRVVVTGDAEAQAWEMQALVARIVSQTAPWKAADEHMSVLHGFLEGEVTRNQLRDHLAAVFQELMSMPDPAEVRKEDLFPWTKPPPPTAQQKVALPTLADSLDHPAGPGRSELEKHHRWFRQTGQAVFLVRGILKWGQGKVLDQTLEMVLDAEPHNQLLRQAVEILSLPLHAFAMAKLRLLWPSRARSTPKPRGWKRPPDAARVIVQAAANPHHRPAELVRPAEGWGWIPGAPAPEAGGMFLPGWEVFPPGFSGAYPFFPAPGLPGAVVPPWMEGVPVKQEVAPQPVRTGELCRFYCSCFQRTLRQELDEAIQLAHNDLQPFFRERFALFALAGAVELESELRLVRIGNKKMKEQRFAAFKMYVQRWPKEPSSSVLAMLAKSFDDYVDPPDSQRLPSFTSSGCTRCGKPEGPPGGSCRCDMCLQRAADATMPFVPGGPIGKGAVAAGDDPTVPFS